MPSTENWWAGEIDWSTPAGQLLQRFLAALPSERSFHVTVFGSAPLQLTVDRQLLSADVDVFSDDDEDLSAWIAAAKLDKTHGGFYLEPGFELSFRTSPRWRHRAKTVQRGRVTPTVPHLSNTTGITSCARPERQPQCVDPCSVLRSREPEELLRAGERIGERAHRGGKVGERGGNDGRGLQTGTGV